MPLATPLITLTVTGEPIVVPPSSMVNVSVPSFTGPFALLIVALSGTCCVPALKLIDTPVADVDAAAALITKVRDVSDDDAKLFEPLNTSLSV